MPRKPAGSQIDLIRRAKASDGHVKVLLRVAHAMAQLDDDQSVLRLLNRTVVKALACDRSSTMLISGQDGSVVLAQSYGTPRDLLPTYDTPDYQRAARRIVAWLEERRRPLVVEGPPYPDVLDPWLMETHGIRALLVVPLLDEGRLIGGITAAYTVPGAAPGRAGVEFVEGLASHAVVALRRARLTEALRASEERYRTLVEDAHAANFVVGADGTLTFAGGRVQAILGYEPDQLVGRRFLSVLAPHHRQAAAERFLVEMNAPYAHRDHPEVQWDAIHRDGSLVSLEISFTVRVDQAGNLREIYGVARDVTERLRLLREAETERRRTRAALRKERRERARTEALLDTVTAAASTLSVRKILIQVCGAVARLSVADRCSIFLYDEASEVLQPLMSLGIEDPGLWRRFQGSTRKGMEEVYGFREALRTRQPYVVPYVPGSGAVSEFWERTFSLKSLAIYPMVVRDKVVGMMTVDSPSRFLKFPREEVKTLAAIARQAAITIDNARLFERARQQAQTDFLTGLPNHRHLQDLFDGTLEAAERDGTPFCVAMADVDNFKLLNDIHGHQVGDDVLRQVAALIQGCIGPADIVGRYGGDEFLFILPGIGRRRGDRILSRVSRAVATASIQVPGQTNPIPVRVSWGTAAYPADGRHRRSLISLADAALREKKARLRRGRSRKVSNLTTRDLAELHPEKLRLAESLLEIIDAKDTYTSEHSRQHASLSLVLADELGLPERERYALWLAGMLHDVGKIGVPDNVLRKPGKLTEEEWEAMRRHATIGENIVRGLFGLEELAVAVGSHHERYDGSGYPRGLKGEEIPRLGRILAVVDAYSAMVRDRPYRKALTEQAAVAELRRHAGTQFDPQFVETFIRALGHADEDAA